MKQVVAAAVIAFLLLLLVHSSSSTKSYSTASNWPSASLVDDVCKKSDTTYGDCVSTLESDPRTRTASDLRSLARIVLETAHANTTKSKEHFEILAKSSITAPDLMAALKKCIFGYDRAAALFSSSRMKIDLDITAASYDAIAAHAGALFCAYQYNSTTRIDVQTIRARNIYLESYATIAFVIINQLGG